ncbi:unnamed protein product [Lactuca virosa]|uniref:non-specific serine/threonine protein kinase n=1 Tax=Lactuca virosa TaxID=75947 RepID=A0AAU9M152_9ASTR|nr:unnamed protein product [Lactuca virosa]
MWISRFNHSNQFMNDFIPGQIPKEFGKMKRMLNLSLADNQLSGIIPPEIGSFELIEVLDLSTNRLNGSLPISIGQWEHIYYLNLSNNKLGEKIPSEIGKLVQLTKLDLSQNFLSDVIPSEIQGLQSLQKLDLSHNRLSGSIPNAFTRLPHGIDINLSYNELSGPVPQSPNFVNASIEGNPGVCGNITGVKLCADQMIEKKNNPSHHGVILVLSSLLSGQLFYLVCSHMASLLIDNKRKGLHINHWTKKAEIIFPLQVLMEE